MKGTEKQVKFAEDIKRKFVKTNDIYVEELGKDLFDATVEYINNTKMDAVYWIETVLKADPNKIFCDMVDEYADYLEKNDQETFNKFFI